MRLVSTSVRKTKFLGERLSNSLKKGDVVVLDGLLGVGKTTFIKGILKGFGFEDREIVSPSFTIISEYKHRRFLIYHIDLYRIDKKEELMNLGYEDYFYSPEGISLIEWGQKIEDILPKYVRVNLSFLGPSKRRITFGLKGYPKEKLKPFINKVESSEQ